MIMIYAMVLLGLSGAIFVSTLVLQGITGSLSLFLYAAAVCCCLVGMGVLVRCFYLKQYPPEMRMKKKILEEKYLEAMAYMSASDGALDGRELTTLRKLLRDELQMDFTAKAAEIVCHRVAGDAYDLENAFAQAAELLSFEEKQQIIRVSVKIAMADHNFEEAELTSLKEIATALNLPEEQWRPILSQYLD